MKVGLVLGAGGVLGGAWLTGGLHALARETGWDPSSADNIVGTCAGSMIGALVACRRAAVVHGRPLGAARASTDSTARDGRPAAEADRSAGATFRFHRGLPPHRRRARWQLIFNALVQRRTATRRLRCWPAGCRAG